MADQQNHTFPTPAKLSLHHEELIEVVRTKRVLLDTLSRLWCRRASHKLCI